MPRHDHRGVRPLCEVIQDFKNQCVAVAMDPQAGTPGVGWSVAPDLHTAEAQALSKMRKHCRSGPPRRLRGRSSSCDGSAKINTASGPVEQRSRHLHFGTRGAAPVFRIIMIHFTIGGAYAFLSVEPALCGRRVSCVVAVLWRRSRSEPEQGRRRARRRLAA